MKRFKEDCFYSIDAFLLNKFYENFNRQANSTDYEKRDLETLVDLLLHEMIENNPRSQDHKEDMREFLSGIEDAINCIQGSMSDIEAELDRISEAADEIDELFEE